MGSSFIEQRTHAYLLSPMLRNFVFEANSGVAIQLHMYCMHALLIMFYLSMSTGISYACSVWCVFTHIILYVVVCMRLVSLFASAHLACYRGWYFADSCQYLRQLRGYRLIASKNTIYKLSVHRERHKKRKREKYALFKVKKILLFFVRFKI